MDTQFIELLDTEELDGEDLRDALKINRTILEANLSMVDFLLLRMEGDRGIKENVEDAAASDIPKYRGFTV